MQGRATQVILLFQFIQTPEQRLQKGCLRRCRGLKLTQSLAEGVGGDIFVACHKPQPQSCELLQPGNVGELLAQRQQSVSLGMHFWTYCREVFYPTVVCIELEYLGISPSRQESKLFAERRLSWRSLEW